MASVKKTIFLSDRLQKLIGPAGGFCAPGEVNNSSLTKRVNTLGERYLQLLEDTNIEEILTAEVLHTLAARIKAHDYDLVNGVRTLECVALPTGSETVSETFFETASLYDKLKGLSFLGKVSAAEWVDQHYPPLNIVEHGVPSSQASPLAFARRMLKAAAAGHLVSLENTNIAMQVLADSGVDCPGGSQVLSALAHGVMPSQEACEQALLEITPKN